jgi:hypothetical protein
VECVFQAVVTERGVLVNAMAQVIPENNERAA